MQEVTTWDQATTSGDMAINTDSQQLVISDGTQWNQVITSGSNLEPFQVQSAILQLLETGLLRADLEPMIRDIINDVIQERKDEQPMFEL